MTSGMPPERSTTSLILAHSAAYLLLILFGAVTMWLLFSLRDNLVTLSLALRVNPWVLRAIDRFGLFLLGLLWLSTLVLIESYFRSGVQKELLLRRAAKAFAIVFLIALVSQSANWLF